MWQAELNDAIIFFDECESLFSQRGHGGSSAMTQLLTEIERFEGIIFLATNRPFDLDEAMYRRITSVHEFSAPNYLQRRAIWRLLTAHEAIVVDAGVDFDAVALKFELTGGFIKNAVLGALLKAVGRDAGNPVLSQGDIHAGCAAQPVERHAAEVTHMHFVFADRTALHCTQRRAGSLISR